MLYNLQNSGENIRRKCWIDTENTGFFSTNNFEKVERTITRQNNSLEIKITFMTQERRDSYGNDTFPKALQLKNRLI